MDKIKRFLADDSLFYGLLIVLVAITSYGLGRHSVAPAAEINAKNQVTLVSEAVAETIPQQAEELRLKEKAEETADPVPPTTGQLIGSKNGTKYHLLTCPGAKQIKEENKVFFDSPEAARAAGYTPAGNCKGLE